MEAGVPLGDVLVNDVIAVNISGNDCLTAILWITGVDGVYRGTMGGWGRGRGVGGGELSGRGEAN